MKVTFGTLFREKGQNYNQETKLTTGSQENRRLGPFRRVHSEGSEGRISLLLLTRCIVWSKSTWFEAWLYENQEAGSLRNPVHSSWGNQNISWSPAPVPFSGNPQAPRETSFISAFWVSDLVPGIVHMLDKWLLKWLNCEYVRNPLCKPWKVGC